MASDEMKPYQEELDRLERKSLRKSIRGLFWPLLFLLAMPLFTYYQASGDIAERTGTVVGLTAEQSIYGHKSFLIVQLESGKKIEARLYKNTLALKGEQVVVEELTKPFGLKQYFFKKYLGDQKTTNP